MRVAIAELLRWRPERARGSGGAAAAGRFVTLDKVTSQRPGGRRAGFPPGKGLWGLARSRAALFSDWLKASVLGTAQLSLSSDSRGRCCREMSNGQFCKDRHSGQAPVSKMEFSVQRESRQLTPINDDLLSVCLPVQPSTRHTKTASSCRK